MGGSLFLYSYSGIEEVWTQAKQRRGNVCVRWTCPEVNVREGSALIPFPTLERPSTALTHKVGLGAELYFIFLREGFFGMTTFFNIVSLLFLLTLK